ncbi:hypothetical protein BSKO_05681 [Bryopsis sp. KO-2023]|nr:hypothetical protein BSKO_05681 [Bryopsis sp. KO-2023]
MDRGDQDAYANFAVPHSYQDWASLPGSVLVSLIKHMEKTKSYRGVHSMLAVCKAWHAEITNNLEALHLNFVIGLPALGREFKRVRKLDLERVTVGPGLEGISNFTNLRILELNGAGRRGWNGVDDGSIVRECMHLPHLSRLEGLVCKGGLPKDITNLTSLVRLSFHRFSEIQLQGSTLGLQSLPLLKSLESLTIAKSTIMTGFVNLCGCMQLTSLTVDSCGRIPASNIHPPPNLRALVAMHSDVGFDCLAGLTGLTRVESLPQHYGFAEVPQVSTLEHLGLYAPGFTFRREDMGVTMHNLTRLDALYARGLIEADILDHVSFPMLKRLSVCAGNIEDEDFQNLTCLTGLESLTVNVSSHRLSRYGPMCLMELFGLSRLVFYPSVEGLDKDCVCRLFLALPNLCSFTLDFMDVVQVAGDELRQAPENFPIFCGTGEIGNPKSPEESKIGGVPLRLKGEGPLLCDQCGSGMILLFQLNYQDLPEQARGRFGRNVVQFLACPACPCTVKLRVLTRRAIDGRGYTMEAPGHVLPWGGAKLCGLRPICISRWSPQQDLNLQFSPKTVQKLAEKYDIDRMLWDGAPVKQGQFPGGSCQYGVFSVGGKRSGHSREHLACRVCNSDMDLMAANVRIPRPADAGDCRFLEGAFSSYLDLIVYCCPFHMDQTIWRFHRPPYDVTHYGEIVDIV